MAIVKGAFMSGGMSPPLGGALGGLGGLVQPGAQQAFQQQALAQSNLFAQLQAQQQFNLGGSPLNGLSDLMGSRPFPFCNCPEPEPEPVQVIKTWGLFAVIW